MDIQRLKELVNDNLLAAQNEAYQAAGSNAYFGNGFNLGVKFVLDLIEKDDHLSLNLYDWYIGAYATDADMHPHLNHKVTFYDINNCLNSNKDIYQCIFIDGMVDSVVRERVFGKLSELLSVPYSEVYDRWLGN